MKKMMKRIGAVLLAVAMMAALGVTGAFGADTDSHTITITNTDQNVPHTYEAYKVFSGSLDANEVKLSNIEWANGVNSAALLTALKGSTNANLVATAAGKDALGNDIAAGDNLFKNCTTAQDVARVIATFQSTNGASDSAGALDAVASLIGANLGTKAADFTADTNDATKYTATVEGDGYYFIKDTTATLTASDPATGTETGSDTLSKFILKVIKDETVVAKDTGITPNKEILGGATYVKAGTKSIGDTDTFRVQVQVPNTAKYENHFVFVMNDKLPAGITFTGITSVTIDNKTVTDVSKASPAPAFDNTYNGAAGYYELKVNNATADYAWEAADYDAVNAEGGQKITLTFKEFKKFVETNNLIGKTITINYTGVINDDADYTPTGNINEVDFQYSNQPDHNYTGDNPDNVTGQTPKSRTRTYTSSVKVLKVDESENALEGAEFTLAGDAMNRTVITGYRYEPTTYTAKTGEEVITTKTYWELNDGSFTDTDPATVTNKTQYKDTTKTYYRVNFTADDVSAKEVSTAIVTNASGVAQYTGLNEGTYTLSETAAPEGFNKIDGNVTFKINWVDPELTAKPDGLTDAQWTEAKAHSGYYLTDVAGTGGWGNLTLSWDNNSNQIKVTVMNKSGSTLPSTGGIGTYVFTVAGVAIMAIAAGLLVIRHKKKAE